MKNIPSTLDLVSDFFNSCISPGCIKLERNILMLLMNDLEAQKIIQNTLAHEKIGSYELNLCEARLNPRETDFDKTKMPIENIFPLISANTTSINLHNNGLKKSDIISLTKCLTQMETSSLEALDFSENPINDDAALIIFELAALKRIKSLNLNRTKVTFEKDALALCLTNSFLTQLSLSLNNLNKGLEVLFRGINKSNIEDLYLDDTRIGSWEKLLYQLGENKKLQKISLNKNDFTDIKPEEFLSYLENTTLSEMHLLMENPLEFKPEFHQQLQLKNPNFFLGLNKNDIKQKSLSQENPTKKGRISKENIIFHTTQSITKSRRGSMSTPEIPKSIRNSIGKATAISFPFVAKIGSISPTDTLGSPTISLENPPPPSENVETKPLKTDKVERLLALKKK